MSDAQQNMAFTRLEIAKLLTVDRDKASTLLSLDAHPLLREYFARQLRKKHPEAWRAAHRRLYEYLCETTKEGVEPTLEELQPLYQAVAHGCQAGMHQEALQEIYFARIIRKGEMYSARKLGAFGSDLAAIAYFFEQPWSRLSPSLTKIDQAWLLNEAAFNLRVLGRLTEAIEPMRAAIKMRVEQEVWHSAAISGVNLSELELILGDVAIAVGDAEQSIKYADGSGDIFQRMVSRTVHADALHQLSRRAEAEISFREAEELLVVSRPDYPLLYSLGGFRYCDLLLVTPERAAWHASSSGKVLPEEDYVACATILESVSRRTDQTLHWAEKNRDSLLDIALNHLTLGRATLYESILEGSSLDPCRTSVQHGVDGLRRAGDTTRLPLGLLTRAWFLALTGAHTGPDSAQTDLDEAWEIAERGPMPLFMADIHMYRARLFFREDYPWESPQRDLAEARRLIVKHGYWRRKEELEDAEQAILGEAKK